MSSCPDNSFGPMEEPSFSPMKLAGTGVRKRAGDEDLTSSKTSLRLGFLCLWKIRAAASPAQTTMPTVIPTIALVPRCEPPVDEGFEIDREGEIADEDDTDGISLEFVATALESLDVVRDTNGLVLEVVATAVEALDVARDTEISV